MILLLLSVLSCGTASAQFLDAFDDGSLDGWTHATGDGTVAMDFRQHDGHGIVTVDATQDRHNIWWALIKRDVSAALDLGRLQKPGYELRIEARIRTSHAPRRVNLHLNTQKTVDFHTHLMEYDIPDTSQWHTISMTTEGFEAEPGDTVNAQLALIDWGLERYRVEIDTFKVDVVDTSRVEPDRGYPVPYHPPIADPGTFAYHVDVAQDAMVDLRYPDMNFNGWSEMDYAGPIPLLTVQGSRSVVLRWDLERYAGARAAGSGLLEVTMHAVQRTETELEELGQVRVVEVLSGDPAWNQETVTLRRLRQNHPLDEVFNPQMIMDVDVAKQPDGATLITLSQPVMQRLLDGETLGLALRPLGPISASFYASEYAGGKFRARLHFNVEKEGRSGE